MKRGDAHIEDLEQRLAAATNANRVLLEALSHDLRTPLNTIIGFADMMEQEILGPVDNKQYRSYIRDICGSGRQMLDILNDVLERQRFEQLEESEKDFRHMFELAPDLICICRGGEILRINPAGATMLGLWPADTLIGRAITDFVHEDFQGLVQDGLDRLVGHTARLPMKLLRAGGGDVDVELAAIPYSGIGADDVEGGDAGHGTLLLIARDVTERNRAVSRVAASERHVRKIMDTVVEGIITADSRGVIETINPAAEQIFGYATGELVGENMKTLFGVEARDLHDAAVMKNPETADADAAAVAGRAREFDAIRKDGSAVPVELSVTSMQNRGRLTYIAALHDITERKLVEAQLVELATLDPLTKMPNRTAFAEALNQALERVRGTDEMFAVLFVDLDNFRNINETRGHVVANKVIQIAGERLRLCLPPGDTAAHFGGDEFMVIMNGITGDEDTEAAARIILDILTQPFAFDDEEVYLTASIGAAIYPVNGETTGELLKNADTALHNVKQRQRGRIGFYAAEQTENIDRWVQLEVGLRKALKNREIYLNFQPKVDLETRRIIGAEALVRWHSRELGFVPPDEFVPVAEETGLIGAIGDWVLTEACRQAVIWNDISETPLHVGVNVSAHQMQQGDLGDKVKLCLEETGLAPKLLELEMTESVMLDNCGTMRAALEELRALGITVAIDDFGTGYSSLSYLTSFPLDTLKVDRAFVMNLPDDRDAVAIARAIVGMAKSLDLHIVAEGIETGNQDGFLNALGCHTGQGYLFGKPLTSDAFMLELGSNVVPMQARM